MRTGDWIVTYTGRKMFLTDPHPDDVCIEDIAHALALTCRYGGHCKQFYSVAQHSYYTMKVVQDELPDNPLIQFYALLHDATEAYLGDVVRPLKRSLNDYREYEMKMMRVIEEGLGLPKLPLTPKDLILAIKQADDAVLMTERRDLVNHGDIPWKVAATPLAMKIVPVNWQVAEKLFMHAYDECWSKIMQVPA